MLKVLKYLKGNDGSALAYVLVVMTVVFLLVTGIITLSVDENYQALYQTDYIKAHYISRAGAEAMAMEIMRLAREDKDKLNYFSTQRFARPDSMITDSDGNNLDLMTGADSLLVSVMADSSSGDTVYKVESVGAYNGIEVTTKLTMSYHQISELNHVLYGNTLQGLAPQQIVGGVGAPGEITFHNTPAAENADDVRPYIEFDIPLIKVDLDGSEMDDGSDLKDEIEGTVIGDIDSDDNTDDGDITVDESGVIKDDTDNLVVIDDLTIDTSSGDDYYKQAYRGIDSYEEFELSDVIDSDNDIDGNEPFVVVYFPHDTWIKGEINVEGGSNVMFIVEDCLYLDGGLAIDGNEVMEIYFDENPSDSGNSVDALSSAVNKNPSYDFVLKNNKDYGEPNKSDQFRVYLYGDEVTVELDNNGTIYGFIISEDAHIDMKNGSTDVYGAVYGDEVDIDASVSIISPNPSEISDMNFKIMSIDYWE